MTQAELLAEQLAGTRDWTLKLLADFSGDDWKFQPAPGMGHALWLCGHLATAQHTLIHARCLNRPFLDEAFASHFPIGAPVAAADEHAYPPPEQILATMANVHERTVAAVRTLTDAQLDEPAPGKDGAPHPHYRDKRGAISHCGRHEAFHAGQIASIRRLLGKPFLR